jgi:hypothetical protein
MKTQLGTAQFGVAGPAVTDAPYSAEAVTESAQTLGDGNVIRRKTTARVFRDGAGRTARQEADATGEFHTVAIYDPVAGVSHFLNPAKKTAVSRPLATAPVAKMVAADLQKKQAAEADAKLNGAEARLNEALAKLKKATAANPGESSHEETLPSQTIEGVKAEGKRVSSTIAAGTIGNDRPIESYSERWYSPEMQINVMTKRHDPRTGDVTYQLTHIQRGEPAAYLFQVPPSYTVESESTKPMPNKKAMQ